MCRAWFLIALAASSCGSSGPPPTYEVTAPGITVRVDSSPLAFTVEDATGRAVLASHAGPTADGYGALAQAGGAVTIRSTVSPGYFATNFNGLGAWQDGYTVTSAKPGDRTLDLVLAASGQPNILVHIALRPSAARFEARVDGAAPRAWSAAFQSPAAEGFLGMGERFTRTNFRGLRMYSWTEEGGIGFGEGQAPGANNPYPNGESMSYYPVPFFVSTGGYGFWLDSTWWNEADLAADHDDAWRIWHIGPTLAFEVYTPIPGDARPWPYHLVDLFTAATGRPMLPPAWSFGPRRRFAAGDMVDGKTQAQAMRDLDLAITAFDDTNHFLPRGEPPGQAADRAVSNAAMRKLGYRATCYFNPFFSDDPTDAIAPTAAAGAGLGYFLKNTAGAFSKGWILTGGNVANLYMLDFTNAPGGGWYTTQFDAALGAGYSGWMYDFGEYTQADAVGANGMIGEELHNLYPVLYQKAAHDKLEASPLAGDWLLYARSGYTGASQYMPAVWSGDPAASFDPADGLPSMVRAAINIGIAGVPNWGGDIGGYHCFSDGAEKADGELLARWIEEGSMEPDMHDENACVGSDASAKATIWSSPDAQAAWKTYARLHTRLQPYYVALSTLAHETGAPIIRHVFFENPDRADWAGVDDAYYLGPAFLVAPVVTRGARERTVTLPAGVWLDWTDGAVLRGGGSVTIPAPLGKLPLLLRDGGLVPMLDPTIDTLSDAEDPSVVTPADVADVYDVVAFLTSKASFTLPDGTSFSATLAGAVAPPALPEAPDEATLATCGGCYKLDDLGGGLSRVRISTTGDGAVIAGGLTLTATHARPRTRWDVYSTR